MSKKPSTAAEREVAEAFRILRGEPKPAAPRPSRATVRDNFRQLREAEGTALVDAPTAPPTDDQGSAPLRQKLLQIVGDAISGQMDRAKAVDQILAAVQDDDQGGDQGDGYEDDEPSDSLTESVELRRLRRERRARELCESVGLRNPTTSQVATVARIPRRADRARKARQLAGRGR